MLWMQKLVCFRNPRFRLNSILQIYTLIYFVKNKSELA